MESNNMHTAVLEKAGTGAKKPEQMRKRPARAAKHPNVLAGLFGLVWLAVIIMPLYYIVITSFRDKKGYFSDNPMAPPSEVTIENYKLVLENDFLRYFGNSLFVTIFAVVLCVGVSLLAAFVICRNTSRRVQLIFQFFLLGLAIPMQATIIPVYLMIIKIGLYDTLWGIILPSASFLIPITLMILVNFIRDIPTSLFESMRLDGASNLRIFRSLVWPLSKPAVITVCIYDAVHVWNGFLFPLILTQSAENRVLPMSLWAFQGEFSVNIPAVLAAVVLSAIPLFLMYLFFRRQLISGMTAGFSK